MYIYNKISALCKNKNITIKDLEQKLNLSNGIIGKWKNSSPNVKYLLMIAEYFQVDINELCYKIDNEEDQRLLANFHYSDTRGKQTILNIAEIEARRSRSERNEITGQQENEGKKLNFTEFTAKHKADQSEQEENNELKPFA